MKTQKYGSYRLNFIVVFCNMVVFIVVRQITTVIHLWNKIQRQNGHKINSFKKKKKEHPNLNFPQKV